MYNGEHSQRSKIRISTRQWYAEKIARRIYGPSMAVGGAPDLPPVRTINSEVPADEAYRMMIEGKAALAK